MMNNNRPPEKRDLGLDPQMFAIANRRREELKKAQMQEQPRPQPKPIVTEPKPQPKPQPRSQIDEKERKRRIAAAEQRRKEAEKRRREEEKQKKDEEKRIEQDRKATERRARADKRREFVNEKLEAVKKINKNVWRDAFAYFVIFLCVLLIICTGAATIFLWNLLNYGQEPETPSSITFTAGKKETDYDYGEIVREGIYYVDFTSVAKLCELSLGGDSEVIIYSTPKGEQIRFTPPSRNVIINGNTVLTEGDILVSGNSERHIWVPLSLLQDYMLGIDIKLEEDNYEESGKPFINITISRTEDGKKFADPAFKLKFNSVLSGLSNESLPEEPITLPDGAPTYEFTADLSLYLGYMCPEDFDKHMVLINPSHPVDATYIPEDLVGVPNPRYDNGASLCRDAAMSLEALFFEMYNLGFNDMKVGIAYRSYEQQEKQFNTYVYNERYYYRSHYASEGKWFSDIAYTVLGEAYLKEKYITKNKTSLSADDAKRVAMSYSAYPGTGDHQTGLAFDLYLSSKYSGVKFAESNEYKWIKENAHKFGFIIRYPEGKENITGYAFEPQHLRFVGQYHAAIIYESGLTLDEYVDKYLNS